MRVYKGLHDCLTTKRLLVIFPSSFAAFTLAYVGVTLYQEIHNYHILNPDVKKRAEIVHYIRISYLIVLLLLFMVWVMVPFFWVFYNTKDRGGKRHQLTTVDNATVADTGARVEGAV